MSLIHWLGFAKVRGKWTVYRLRGRYESDGAAFTVKIRGRIGEIIFEDSTGTYSVPIELAFAKRRNYCAHAAIDVKTGRWVVGARAQAIFQVLNDAFQACDGEQLSTEVLPDEVAYPPQDARTAYSIGNRRVSRDEWIAHQKRSSPKDGELSPYYGDSGRPLLP